MEIKTQSTEQQLETQRKARGREGIADRAVRAKAKELGWKSSNQTLDAFMFELHWVRYGTGQNVRWFEIKWD